MTGCGSVRSPAATPSETRSLTRLPRGSGDPRAPAWRKTPRCARCVKCGARRRCRPHRTSFPVSCLTSMSDRRPHLSRRYRPRRTSGPGCCRTSMSGQRRPRLSQRRCPVQRPDRIMTRTFRGRRRDPSRRRRSLTQSASWRSSASFRRRSPVTVAMILSLCRSIRRCINRLIRACLHLGACLS